MMIQHIEQDRVYADVIGLDTPNEMILRKNVYEPRIVKLVIPDSIVDRIKSGQQKAIIHDLSPRWQKLYNINPEIISLRSAKYKNKYVVCSVQQIRVQYPNREKLILTHEIRVEFSEIIYKG